VGRRGGDLGGEEGPRGEQAARGGEQLHARAWLRVRVRLRLRLRLRIRVRVRVRVGVGVRVRVRVRVRARVSVMPAPAGREHSCSSRAGLSSTSALRLPC